MSNEYCLKDLLPFLELDEYISFDLETTGLNPERDKITEIAASKFVNGEFIEEFTTLIYKIVLSQIIQNTRYSILASEKLH